MELDYYVDLVRTRLCDDGTPRPKIKDDFGNEIDAPKQVFTDEQIIKYLETSVNRLNLLFDLDLILDGPVINKHSEKIHKYADLLVQGAVITALGSRALLERGREWSYEDNGVTYTPPDVSSLMQTQWELESADYRTKIELLLGK